MDIISLMRSHCRKIFVAVIILPLFTNAQMIEVAGGTNLNTVYIPNREMYKWNNIDYGVKPGWSVALKMSQFSKWGDPVIAINIDKYNSALSLSRFSKTTVSLGFYPVNLTVYKNLYLQAGPELSFLFSAKGERSIYITDISSGSGYGTIQILTAYSDMWNQKIHLGASASLSYRFKLNNSLYITPEYKYYNGLLMPEIEDEFNNYFSRRHSFMIAIGKKFNN